MAFKPPKNKKPTGSTTINPVGISRYSAVNFSAPSAAPVAPAPPPTYGAPSTHDSAYDAAVAGAGKALGDTQAYLAGQAQMLRGAYGYADDSFTIDPTNPFGRAQLLKRAYDQSVRGTTNSYAARGQQTSGAYGRMQGQNLFQNQQQTDALQKQFLSDRANLLYQGQQAQSQYGAAVGNAAGDALQRAIDARNAYQVQPALTQGQKSAAAHGGAPRIEYRNGKTVRRYPDGYTTVS